tara:strand:+ start:67 stop:480 length:414 start_codon:yes stop_codon:yes gene_type:complete
MEQGNNNTSVSFSIRNQGELRKGESRYDKISLTDNGFDGYRDFISKLESGADKAVKFAKYIGKYATNLTVWHNDDADDARQTAESLHSLLEWKGDIYDSTVDTNTGEKDVTNAARYESQGVSSERLLSAFTGVLQDR